MYKYIFLLLIILCVMFVGCTSTQESIITADEHSENVVDSEDISEVFATTEDLLASLVTTSNGVNTNGNISNIETIYEIAVDFEDYELFQVELTDYDIIYYYRPVGEKGIFNYDTGIEVTYSREGMNHSNTTLDTLAEQYGLDYTEDGFIYREKYNAIYFSVGETLMKITVPDSMNNYETLKELCVAREVTVGTQPDDGLVIE